jgi:hypothetical protein
MKEVHMALRTFTDSTGREWEVYDVIPRSEERRHYDRRSLAADDDAMAVAESADRRDADRRLTVGGAEHISARTGWLCFDSQEERRRLMPIPEGWERSDEGTLEGYLREARPARLSAEFRSAK